MYKWLLGLERFGMKLGLKRMEKLSYLTGNPEKYLRIIHVGGTNGKGSVCAMLSSVLTQAGYSTGMYTSPHLVDVKERIRLDDKIISEKDFEKMVRDIKKYHDKMKDTPPTFFETLTAATYKLFKEKNVDFAIIEVGLGGELDATNIAKPLIGIVVTVDFDHTEILGNTIRKIAKDKAQILKGPVSITGETKRDALEEIRKACKKNDSKLIIVRKRSNRSPLLGEHQKLNTAIVLEAIRQLRKMGYKISERNVSIGLKKTWWPGRSEIVSKKPLILIDGAHNPAGIASLKKMIKQFRYDKLNIVMGIKDTKDYKTMIKEIAPLADKMIFTESHVHPRSAKTLSREAKKYCKDIIIIKDVKSAVRHALKQTSKNDMLCICGSLFVVGEARGILV